MPFSRPLLMIPLLLLLSLFLRVGREWIPVDLESAQNAIAFCKHGRAKAGWTESHTLCEHRWDSWIAARRLQITEEVPSRLECRTTVSRLPYCVLSPVLSIFSFWSKKILFLAVSFLFLLLCHHIFQSHGCSIIL